MPRLGSVLPARYPAVTVLLVIMYTIGVYAAYTIGVYAAFHWWRKSA